MCMEQLHVLKCAWSSAACAEMCMCMSSECESDGEHIILSQLKALHSVEAVWQVGPGAVSVSVVSTEDDFLVLCCCKICHDWSQ